MKKIEKPEDVVVVSRRELMRLSSLAAAGSVVFGALELGKTERGYSLGRGAAADPGDSDAVFGGAETAATTGWEIIAAWLALTTRSDKLTGCLLYRGRNGECSKVATEDLNLNDAGGGRPATFCSPAATTSGTNWLKLTKCGGNWQKRTTARMRRLLARKQARYAIWPEGCPGRS